MNRRGPPPVDLSPPEPVEPAELRRRIEAGEWVVDLRTARRSPPGTSPAAVGFELSDPSSPTWAGSTARATPLT